MAPEHRVLLGPDGLIGRYRKTHLPYVGVDRFTVAGDEPYVVHETAIGRIGLEICYDLRFSEVTRILALRGAEIVAHPTNFPRAARSNCEFLTRARAAENRVFLLTANRIGDERNGGFCGWSQIVGPTGESSPKPTRCTRCSSSPRSTQPQPGTNGSSLNPANTSSTSSATADPSSKAPCRTLVQR
jgi:predicted amidohydrolase